MASIGQSNGKTVTVDVPWGKAIRGSHVAGKVPSTAEAVTFISNESSTGVLNPTQEIVKAIRADVDPMIFVDGVTSTLAVDLKLKELNIDALVFGSQKALALPPGLAIICASDRLLKKAETVKNRGYYFDLIEIKKIADKDLPLTTPPVSLMYGLDYHSTRC
jgi:aspartate aminotransferase-like enzyme